MALRDTFEIVIGAERVKRFEELAHLDFVSYPVEYFISAFIITKGGDLFPSFAVLMETASEKHVGITKR